MIFSSPKCDVDKQTNYGAADGGTSAEAQATVVELLIDEASSQL
jgi:hypothetical protein